MSGCSSILDRVEYCADEVSAEAIKAKADEYVVHFDDAGYLGGFATTCLAVSEEFEV